MMKDQDKKNLKQVINWASNKKGAKYRTFVKKSQRQNKPF